LYVDDSKLSEQEAREKASTDQLASTDIRTREFENMVHLYKYVVFHQELGFNSFIGRYRCRVWQFTAGLTAMETHMPYRIIQCHLAPGRGDIPALSPAEAGTRFSDPGGMQG